MALVGCVAGLLAGCAAGPRDADVEANQAVESFVAETRATSVLGDDAGFLGSPLEDVGLTGLFPVRGQAECSVAGRRGGFLCGADGGSQAGHHVDPHPGPDLQG